MGKKVHISFLIAITACLAACLLSLSLGTVRLSLTDLMHAVFQAENGLSGNIFWYSRLPRTAACMLSGAALAVSGAIVQGVLSNKLASPSIIGVNAGAGLSVTLCCACGILSGWAIAAFSFLGAMVSVLLIVFTAQKTGASRTTVILAGIAVNSLLNALSDTIITLFPDTASLSGDFRVGGFSSVSYTRLIPAGAIIILALLLAFTLCNELDVLTLGADTAHSLGLSVGKTRILLLILAAMLAGASVSFAGLLGFVGLIVPHTVRKFVGNESRYLLPLCAFGGAGFVTFCDLAARLAFSPYELPVGVFMSVLGGPFFIALLIKKKGGRAND